MPVRRRVFLAQGLMLMLAGLGRRLWAQAVPRRYRRLAGPVVVPLADLTTPWRAKTFMAEAVTLSSAATPNQPIRLSGMVVRTSAGDHLPAAFTAICVRCPHEGCDVDFVPDPNSLPQDVKDEIGHAVDHAVYICPCHNSTFQAEDGARLSGPAPRGLYRFGVTGVTDAAVEIGEVEEDLLIFV
ncbi:MAG: Rieske 2Fe-2S domain-containing protein [Vicinamibacterales bacterium]